MLCVLLACAQTAAGRDLILGDRRGIGDGYEWWLAAQETLSVNTSETQGKNTGLLLDLNRQDFRLKGRDLVWVCHLRSCTLLMHRVGGGRGIHGSLQR